LNRDGGTRGDSGSDEFSSDGKGRLPDDGVIEQAALPGAVVGEGGLAQNL